jgi:hypothetical protein
MGEPRAKKTMGKIKSSISLIGSTIWGAFALFGRFFARIDLPDALISLAIVFIFMGFWRFDPAWAYLSVGCLFLFLGIALMKGWLGPRRGGK